MGTWSLLQLMGSEFGDWLRFGNWGKDHDFPFGLLTSGFSSILDFFLLYMLRNILVGGPSNMPLGKLCSTVHDSRSLQIDLF